MKFTNILVPFDKSDHALHALTLAKGLAEEDPAIKLHVIGVVFVSDIPPALGLDANPYESAPPLVIQPDLYKKLVEAALDRAVEHAVSQGYHTFLSGMAAGFDIWAAEAVIRARAHHDIRLLCAVPHDHQSDRFAPSWKKRYNVCLVNSDAVRVFASNYFSGCFSVRNRFMVDSSSLLICYFDGQAGGTAQTVHYAQSSGLHIINLSPRTYDQLSLL